MHQLEGSEHPLTSPPDDSVDPFSLSLYNLSSGQQGIEIPVELNRTSLLMELDTGGGVSVISKETYKKTFSGTPLMPSNTRLRAYAGHPLKVHGQCIAHLKYQLRKTIQNLPNVFKPGLGTVKGITAKLEMKPDARPKFCKARPVPSTLQEAVKTEYNRTRVIRNCRTGGIQ